jgi:hypothetical protein
MNDPVKESILFFLTGTAGKEDHGWGLDMRREGIKRRELRDVPGGLSSCRCRAIREYWDTLLMPCKSVSQLQCTYPDLPSIISTQ